MLNLARLSIVFEMGREPLTETELTINFSQKQKTGMTGDMTARKLGLYGASRKG